MARAKGITLIGVQMPMYGPLVRYLEKDKRFGILADFRAHVASGYFARLGVTVFDYLDLKPYSDDKRYFIDPWHPTEVIMAHEKDDFSEDNEHSRFEEEEEVAGEVVEEETEGELVVVERPGPAGAAPPPPPRTAPRKAAKPAGPAKPAKKKAKKAKPKKAKASAKRPKAAKKRGKRRK